MIRLGLLVSAALLGATAAATAAPLTQSGAEIVRHGAQSGVIPCMACHGGHLEGTAAIGAPALAGLPQTRSLAALNAIATGKQGHNFVMRREARLLTTAQRQAIATYLAQLPKGAKPAS